MEQIEFIVLPLIIAYILDLILGDPRNWPHLIVGFGNIINLGTKSLNHGKYQLIKGASMSVSLILITYSSFYFLSILLLNWDKWIFIIITSIFIFYGLANKSLLEEGVEVFKHLENKGLKAGRKRLSWIVGRDTKDLNKQEIRLAVFETLSENLSDGVVAPLFYYALGGLPAMMTYKMINTLDSMIGYKNDKYLYFGRVAARIDDVANFIPARLTAFLMICVTFSYRGFIFIFKYGRSHTSPNAGYPESALAGILNCRFGGAHKYGGQLVNKPYIGKCNRKIENFEIKRVAYINHAVCFLTIVIISTFYCAINSLI